MLLSDHDLLNAMTEGSLGVHPFDRMDLQPASIDVHLSGSLRLFTASNDIIDTRQMEPWMTTPETIPDGQFYLLEPGEFILASTIEVVQLGPTLAARLEGKSSLGRLGLLTHATAGFIDPGFCGQITLELCNINPTRPITLWAGMKIGQLCVIQMSSEVMNPYGSPILGSHYQNQMGPTAARVGESGW